MILQSCRIQGNNASAEGIDKTSIACLIYSYFPDWHIAYASNKFSRDKLKHCLISYGHLGGSTPNGLEGLSQYGDVSDIFKIGKRCSISPKDVVVCVSKDFICSLVGTLQSLIMAYSP